MNKKSTQILVVVLCFVASGLVLYYGYFKPQAESKIIPLTTTNPELVTAKENQQILPLNKLQEKDLKPLRSINGDSYSQKYPKLDPKTEVGIEVKDLIPPLGQTQQ